MTEETLNAAISLLRSKALETYGIMKDIYARPAAQGDVDLLAKHSLQLAQLEGGLLTLQQYAPDIIKSASARDVTDPVPSTPEVKLPTSSAGRPSVEEIDES